MPLTVKLLPIIGILLCFFSMETNAQKSHLYLLKETQPKQPSDKIERILLIAAGYSSERLFSENLHFVLQQQLKRSNVRISYQFSTISDSDTSVTIKPDTKVSYDAALFLLPDSLSTFSIQTKKTADIGYMISAFIFQPVTPTSSHYSRTVNFHQHYNLSLYSYRLKNDSIPLWKATLQINFDPTTQFVYENIAREIIQKLALNKSKH
jgi:hypothetical protein